MDSLSRPWFVETVDYGWINATACGCTCDPDTGEWWSVCRDHGAS